MFEKIFGKIKRENLDGFLFSSYSNVFYLSKFSSSNAFVILTDKGKYFITDSRYYDNAKEKLKDFNVIKLGEGNKKGLNHLKEILESLNLKNVGFEKDKITLSFYEKLTKDISMNFIGFEGFLNEFRMVKSEEEIKIITQAVRKTDRVYKRVLEDIPSLIGKPESSIRQKIVNYIFEEGGTGESFPAIVASGKHSAIPHWETSSHKIKNNAPLLIDMGMKYKGYCSDFTRTIFLGKSNPKFEKIYNIVKEAHLKALSVVKAGIPIKEIDLAARKVIEKYGYGEYFTHSTGHGVGIDIHEEPRIYKDNEGILQENTVFTIEPGIYIPGFGGVRLENIVVVRKDKGEVLSKVGLDLIYL